MKRCRQVPNSKSLPSIGVHRISQHVLYTTMTAINEQSEHSPRFPLLGDAHRIVPQTANTSPRALLERVRCCMCRALSLATSNLITSFSRPRRVDLSLSHRIDSTKLMYPQSHALRGCGVWKSFGCAGESRVLGSSVRAAFVRLERERERDTHTHTHIAHKHAQRHAHRCIHLHSVIWISFGDDQVWSAYMDLA